MCGIAGIFNMRDAAPIDSNILHCMVDRQRHRGPDETGFFTAPGIGLGMSRLSINDPCKGQQPHVNEFQTVRAVCNGELYDFRQRQRDLEARGHQFRASSDTEALVHLHEDQGPEMFRHLNGQFACAIWDESARSLTLARDHVGIAPLYYCRVDDLLVFASEIKGLLAHPALEPRIDMQGLDQILTWPGLISPQTMFAGIQALPPGHMLRVQRGESPRLECYWDLEYPQSGSDTALIADPEMAREELDHLMRQAVARRIDADSEVGFYLSGGLDSALIATLGMQSAPHSARQCFSIQFPGTQLDESAHQRQIAQSLAAQHHQIPFGTSQIPALLQDAVQAAETPLRETYNCCSLALSRAVQNAGLKTVLTGEGADELFAGYVGYRLDLLGREEFTEDLLEMELEQETRGRIWGHTDFNYERQLNECTLIKQALYAPELRKQHPDFDSLRHPPINLDRFCKRHPLHKRSYADFKLRLSDHLLADHGDRVLMASSVEGRYPFLDLDVLEFCQRLSPELLIRQGTEKWLLKQVARKFIPSSVVNREKFAFVAPGSPYLLREHPEWTLDHLSPERIARQGYFDPVTITRLVKQYQQPGFEINQTFDVDILMQVLTFSILHDQFIINRGAT